MSFMQLFNTDLSLWKNYLKSNPDHKLVVTKDGRVWSNMDGTLAQFESGPAAITVLYKAGYSSDLIEVKD